jgi:hypothetical protein
MILSNGTVLPHGLQSVRGYEANVAAFNQSYRNTGIKAGFITASYAANDPNNKSKLCTEYDVFTIEQFENKGTTSILYKNCLSSQGFGSIADFFEFTLRYKTTQNQTGAPTFSDQDGAIVLIKCLDNCGDKAIVVGNLIHPDRPTDITSIAPQMAGEYNGVAVTVNNDGSCSFTFKGATDSQGVPTDPSQGNTTVQIATDGSFSIQHSAVTVQLQRSGEINITCTGAANIIAQGTTTVDGSTIKLGKDATQSVIRGDDFAEIFNNHAHLGNLGFPTSPPLAPMDESLSKHVFTE